MNNKKAILLSDSLFKSSLRLFIISALIRLVNNKHRTDHQPGLNYTYTIASKEGALDAQNILIGPYGHWPSKKSKAGACDSHVRVRPLETCRFFNPIKPGTFWTL